VWRAGDSSARRATIRSPPRSYSAATERGCSSIGTCPVRPRRDRARRGSPERTPGRNRIRAPGAVGIKRDVGDGCSDRPRSSGCSLRWFSITAERAKPSFHPVLERVLLQLASALDQREPEIGRANWVRGYAAENIHCSARARIDAVRGPQRRSADQVPEDRVRLGE